MRALAVLLNIALIITLFFLFYDNGMPRENEILLASLMFLAPVFSLAALFLNRRPNSESLLSLYFKRRRLEESQKIRDLSE